MLNFPFSFDSNFVYHSKSESSLFVFNTKKLKHLNAKISKYQNIKRTKLYNSKTAKQVAMKKL